MKNWTKVALVGIFLWLPGCVSTTGEIQGNRFVMSHNFTVEVLDSDWEVIRQQTMDDMGIHRESSVFEVAFKHKKSNGFIGINSMVMDAVDQARPLEVHAEETVARLGMKLSQEIIKINNKDAMQLVCSGTYMTKHIFVKNGNMAYELVYQNTKTYFDQYLPVFDQFVRTFVPNN